MPLAFISDILTKYTRNNHMKLFFMLPVNTTKSGEGGSNNLSQMPPASNRERELQSQLIQLQKRSGLIKFVVGRSQGCATELVLPAGFITTSDLRYVSDLCPALKILELRHHLIVDNNARFTMSELFVNWKSMEVLMMSPDSSDLVQIVSTLGLHSYKLSISHSSISHEIASAIVSKLSNLRCLVLDKSDLQKVDLELILRGCKHLDLLYARNCVGSNEDDEKILIWHLELRTSDVKVHPNIYLILLFMIVADVARKELLTKICDFVYV